MVEARSNKNDIIADLAARRSLRVPRPMRNSGGLTSCVYRGRGPGGSGGLTSCVDYYPPMPSMDKLRKRFEEIKKENDLERTGEGLGYLFGESYDE